MVVYVLLVQNKLERSENCERCVIACIAKTESLIVELDRLCLKYNIFACKLVIQLTVWSFLSWVVGYDFEP